MTDRDLLIELIRWAIGVTGVWLTWAAWKCIAIVRAAARDVELATAVNTVVYIEMHGHLVTARVMGFVLISLSVICFTAVLREFAPARRLFMLAIFLSISWVMVWWAHRTAALIRDAARNRVIAAAVGGRRKANGEEPLTD